MGSEEYFIQKQLSQLCAETHHRVDFPQNSGFRVVAVLRTQSGKYFEGTNYEGASAEETICAERVALAHAWMNGETGPFTHIYVVGDTNDRAKKPIPPTAPCGSCRQVLFEMSDVWQTPMTVSFGSYDGFSTQHSTIADLLPKSFGPTSMGIKHVQRHARLSPELVENRVKLGSDLGQVTPANTCWQSHLVQLAKQAAEFSYIPYVGPKEGTAIAFRDPRLPVNEAPLRVALGARLENAAFSDAISSSMMARALARLCLGTNPDIVSEITETI